MAAKAFQDPLILLNIARKTLRCFCIFGWQKIFSAILSPYSQEQMPETECSRHRTEVIQ